MFLKVLALIRPGLKIYIYQSLFLLNPGMVFDVMCTIPKKPQTSN